MFHALGKALRPNPSQRLALPTRDSIRPSRASKNSALSPSARSHRLCGLSQTLTVESDAIPFSSLSALSVNARLHWEQRHCRLAMFNQHAPIIAFQSRYQFRAAVASVIRTQCVRGTRKARTKRDGRCWREVVSPLETHKTASICDAGQSVLMFNAADVLSRTG
jgi:hypothetical protein